VDDVLTSVWATASPGTPGLRYIGSMRQGAAGGGGLELRLFASLAFRELVVFTPAHRQAFCLEPYTCTTNAINLQQSGTDAGWVCLQPGQQWASVVEMGV
jgi:aldose 1-epimerase